MRDPQRGKQAERRKKEPDGDRGSRNQEQNSGDPVRQFRRGGPEAHVKRRRAAVQPNIDHPAPPLLMSAA